ncbi:MAG: hypothetical protein ABWY29_08370 [Blastococcus sp.]
MGVPDFDNCVDQVKHTWVFDVREPADPVSISTSPQPREVDYCATGAHFGPHNLHENRPGSFFSEQLAFATYQGAGVRVFDLADPFRPEEVAAFVPPPPARMFDTRPGRPRVIQSCDVFADADGVLYVTDYNAGLYVLQYEGS